MKTYPARRDIPLTGGCFLVVSREINTEGTCIRLLRPDGERMVYATPKVYPTRPVLTLLAERKECRVELGELRIEHAGPVMTVTFRGEVYTGERLAMSRAGWEV